MVALPLMVSLRKKDMKGDKQALSPALGQPYALAAALGSGMQLRNLAQMLSF